MRDHRSGPGRRQRFGRMPSVLVTAALLLSTFTVVTATHGAASAAPVAVTGAYLDSEADAYLGGGLEQVFPAAQVQPSSWVPDPLHANQARFVVGTWPDQFEMWFAAPSPQTKFTVGTYENAVRITSGDPSSPGIEVFGQGRGCNEFLGRFLVDQVGYTGDTISVFAVRFELRCDAAAGQVFGGVSYNATAPYRTRTIAPQSLDFGARHAGTVSSSQTITLTNDGPSSLTNSGVTITGTDAADFGLVADTCKNVTLPAGSSCTVSVVFAPSGNPIGPPGPRAARLTFFDDNAPLGGSGRDVVLSASSTTWTITPALAFGDEPVGFRSAVQHVVFRNDGPTDIVLGGGGFAGADASQWVIAGAVPACFAPAAVPPGGTCDVPVAFAPTGSPGPRSAIWTFSDVNFNAYGSTTLSGSATARSWVVVPSSLSFVGSIGGTAQPQSVTVTNNGIGPLRIHDALIGGPDAAEFALLARPACLDPGSIPPGGTCSLSVLFLPSGSPGPRSASLSLIDELGNVYGFTTLNGAAVDAYGEYTAVTPSRVFDTRDGTGQGGVPHRLPGGEVRDVQIAGQGGLPASGLTAVVMNVTVTNPSVPGWLRVWPSGEPQPLVSNLNFVAGQTVPNLVTVPVGADGRVSVSSMAGNVDVIFDVVGSYATSDGNPGGRFHGTTPSRLLDTRTTTTPIGPRATRSLKVTGVGGVPATDVTAVVLNVTITQPTEPSFLTVWPADVPQPLASNLNYVPGHTVPNLVVVRVPASGTINFYNLAGTAHVVIDVTGWYDHDRSSESGRFIPVDPQRMIDTREGFGPLGPDEIASLTWYDDANRPLYWLGGVVLNVTVTEPTASGFVTVFPDDAALPLASNLNFVAGQTVPNLVMVRTSTPGAAVDFYNRFGYTHLVVDMFGAFTNRYADVASLASRPPSALAMVSGIHGA